MTTGRQADAVALFEAVRATAFSGNTLEAGIAIIGVGTFGAAVGALTAIVAIPGPVESRTPVGAPQRAACAIAPATDVAQVATTGHTGTVQHLVGWGWAADALTRVIALFSGLAATVGGTVLAVLRRVAQSIATGIRRRW